MADSEEFKWTPKLSEEFIHFRLQNEWLFKKKKQPWNDFRQLMIENNFHPSITVHQIRKKWNYILDDYHKAIVQNNRKWVYYDIFNRYLGTSNHLEAYSNWKNEWLFRLIEIRTEHESLFSQTNSECDDGWNFVECELRRMGLPNECSVKNIDKIWFSLIKTFKIMHKFNKDSNSSCENPWIFYDSIKTYFKTVDPQALDLIKKRSTKRKLTETIEDDNNSDDEIPVLNKNVYLISKNICSESDNADNGADEFRWTPEWTESFIHIRLQNEDLFKQKKQAWKDLHAIMMENGFPSSITVHRIRKKWNSTFEDYQRAVATNNTKWIYYNIMYNYLGKSDFREEFKNWTDDWVKRFIKIRLKSNEIFKANKMNEDDCWAVVEGELRTECVPAECSVRNIHLMWSSLIKTFKIKHKYIDRNKSDKVWEFYEDMKDFFEKCDPDFLARSCTVKMKRSEQIPDFDVEDDMLFADSVECKIEEDTFKKESFSIDACRACLGKSGSMTMIFENRRVPEMIFACTSIQVSELDNLPKQICKTCLEQLEVAFKFRKKYQATDQMLKSMLSDVHLLDIEMKTEKCSEIPMANSPDFNYDNESDMDDKPLSMLNTNYNKDDIKNIKKYKRKDGRKFKTNDSGMKSNKKSSFKSKNIVITPIVTESGETVYKRKYVYYKVCDICGKSTQRMKEHMKGHSDVKSHKCTKCPKTFTYSASLQTHMRTHDSTPLKVCQLCGKEFFRNLTYKRHLVYHANERKFSCERCGKTFNTSDILKVHIRSHTGERPYACKVCGKAFYSRGCVARHQKIHRKQLVVE